MRKLLTTILALFAIVSAAQRPFDPILELQVTTGMNGIVLAKAPDITVATLSGFVLSGDTLYNTATNTDAQTFNATGTTNPSLVVAGGTGGGGSVQIVGAGIASPGRRRRAHWRHGRASACQDRWRRLQYRMGDAFGRRRIYRGQSGIGRNGGRQIAGAHQFQRPSGVCRCR